MTELERVQLELDSYKKLHSIQTALIKELESYIEMLKARPINYPSVTKNNPWEPPYTITCSSTNPK